MLKKWPKSVTVLRAYASFLEEVKNDLELSHITFALANELEEEKSKKHSNKKKDKSKKDTEKGKKVIAFEETSDEDLDKLDNIHGNHNRSINAHIKKNCRNLLPSLRKSLELIMLDRDNIEA